MQSDRLCFARSSFGSVTNNELSISIARTRITTTTKNMVTKAACKPECSINEDFGKSRGKGDTHLVTVPLIDIAGSYGEDETNFCSAPSTQETSRALVCALQDTGFALVRSPLLSKDLQTKALEAASSFLATSSSSEQASSDVQTPLVDAIHHPTDPKIYSMLNSEDQFEFVSPPDGNNRSVVKEYVHALRSIKMDVLRLIAIGLGVDDAGFLAKLHDEHNDNLRLITYFPTMSESTGNRCKEHSDYGTITLLSTDGVSGLELFHEGRWLPVPRVEGALVVNVGSLLAGWTKGSLRATLHRVAGPASTNSRSNKEDLLEAVNHPRTSVAFFADPNQDVSASLEATATKTQHNDDNAASIDDTLAETLGGMSVAEYIRWRAGGEGAERSGVSFTTKESEIVNKPE